MRNARLTELPDYHVAPGDTDIRGWRLHDRTGQPAGVIEDLIVDTEARRVSEVLVDLNGHDRLIPIGAVALDEARQTATVQMTLDELTRMPEAPHWHSHEREVIRATFFPELADAPIIGELRREDLEARAYRSHEPRIRRVEERLGARREP